MAETTNFTSLHADDGYIGDVTGNVTGDTFGTHTGDVKTSSIQDLDGTQQIGVSASGVSVASDLTILGNLIVQGGETLLNTQTLEVEDFNIVIGNGNETSSVLNGQGITLHGGSGSDITFQYGSNGYMYLSNKLQVTDEVKTTSVIADSAEITNLQATLTGDVIGNVSGQVSDISNHSTTNLTEGNNLYWTPARSDARIALQVGANLDLSQKSTTELAEGTNLYYTEARVDANIASKSTDDLAEGSNLYFTDARVQANRLDEMSVPTSNLDINSVRVTNVATPVDDADATTKLWVEQRIAEKDALSELSGTTDDLTEGSTNLFLTPNAQTIDGNKTITGATNVTGSISVPTPISGTHAVNKDYLDNAIASIDELSELIGDTDNLTEGSTNLFYTDARVYSALSGGTGVTHNGSGEFSIGQPVGTADDVQFQKVFVREGTGVGVDLKSQTNNASLRFHTSNGQTGIISTTNGNAPVQVYSSLLWARAINGGTGNFTADGDVTVGGDLSVTGTISSPTITALEAQLSGDTTALQAELDATQAGAGLNADGTYTANATANYIASSSSLQDADNDLDAALKFEEASRQAADSTLQSNIDTEEASRIAGDATLQSNIDTEEAARIAGDASTLSSANSYTNTAVANLVDSAPATLDTLNEIAAALGDDPNLSVTLTNQIAGVQTNLDAEIATTDAEITALQAADSAEQTARIAADNTLQSNIDSEAATRSSADTTLQSNIDTVSANLASEISATDAEITALQAADVTLQSNIDAEASARSTADTTLQANIDSEASTRATADTTLQSNIDAVASDLASEIATTDSEITALQSADTAEATARASADTTLQSNIDTVAANLATEISTTDGEISALQSAHTTLQSNIDTVQSNLDAEISDRDLYFINESNTTKVLNPLRGSSVQIGNNVAINPAVGFATQFNRDVEFDNNTKLYKGGVELLPTFAELNFVDGVTSNIQTQLDSLSSEITTEETDRIAGDASTLSSAQSYTDTAIANLVDSAPGTLDTLNELAAALGDDPNFATTITTSIGTKLATADFDSTFDTRLATKTTDDLTEGTNLYYTDARSRSAISAGGDLSYNSTTGVVSFTERTDAEVNTLADARIAAASVTDLSDVDQSLATTDAVTFEKVTINQTGTDNGMVINQSHANAGLHIDATQNGLTIDSAATAFGGVMFRAFNGSSVGVTVGTDGNTTFSGNVTAQGTILLSGTPTATGHAVPKSYVDAIGNDVDDLVTLSGVAAGSLNLGTFTGTTISDNVTVKQALQELETSLESNTSPSSTDDLSEGSTNLYYTDGRSRSAISVSGDLSYNSSTGVISFTERTDAQVNSLADARIAAASLGDLNNVTETALAEGDILRYNKTSGEWENVIIEGTTNIEVEYTPGSNTLTVKHGTSHFSKTYDNADNGTATNDLPITRAEVILDIAGTATNDVYLNIPQGSEGQELVLIIDSAFSSIYNIYLNDSGSASNATNMYGTFSLGAYNRTAVLRYCGSLGLWTFVGGDAYVTYT